MKKIILCAYIALVAAVACTPKASPTTTDAIIPEASSVSSNQATIDAGHTIFTTKCTKCHGAKDKAVASKSYEELRPILASMTKKAKLSKEEIEQVSAYVYANAKK
ncbi:cytochrome c [Niabella sp. CC-SYL272]|uniref:c-type cytochrome n=1 Tax=Niabella agricola TaxID=2891571 RepID=UPI001F2EE3AE|nr:cytochrome c [Niabella agricola]MCF3111143.1 cytochrome c [Niabella agricola]